MAGRNSVGEGQDLVRQVRLRFGGLDGLEGRRVEGQVQLAVALVEAELGLGQVAPLAERRAQV